MIPDFLFTVWPYFFAVANTVFSIVTSCHVVLTKRDNRSALGWVGIIWLVPFFGGFLYVMFGVNRIHRKARRLMKSQAKSAAPPLEYCTDNAAMAAIAWDLLKSGRTAGLDADVLPGLVRLSRR